MLERHEQVRTVTINKNLLALTRTISETPKHFHETKG